MEERRVSTKGFACHFTLINYLFLYFCSLGVTTDVIIKTVKAQSPFFF